MTTLNLSNFSAISLNQLNAQASLMDRGEKKYLMHYHALPQLLEALRDEFAVLQIQDNSIFAYHNVYMDTKELDFYYDHNDRKPDRIKVRTRHYVDSDLYFFEFKQKNNGHMRKFRYEIEKEQHGVMDQVWYNFIEDVYASLFDRSIGKFIFPSLSTQYQRVTLCHKTKPEKITIDFALKVKNLRAAWEEKNSCSIDNLVIIESKTNEEFSIGQELIDANGGNLVATCSKYCIGNNLLENIERNNHFVPTLEIVENIMKGGKVLSKRKMIKTVEKSL